MDEQERPVTEAAEGGEPATSNRALLAIGILFLVVGTGLFLGPGDGGVAFVVIGLVFLASARVQRRR
ncbi:hypothetical protein [Cellulomonas sp. Leaf334]|uniref:hypothetical protein n=1 Tax=Cellulomonas sp. Leaf334 TaxID=1736339 RepID=UPI0006F9C7F4|nr:hypothetical protein [Cellulomonas sp. Leaf334]KQR17143.1 hypothetical protein ASF78_07495 [Cellulomonas sp. Leaf334]